MCSISTIRLIIMIFSWVKLCFNIYIFGIGCYLASSTDFKQAFGLQFLHYGLSLVFLALLSIAMIYPMKYGVDRHNRFLLMMVFVFETIVFAEMINFGVVLQSYTVPEFSKTLQLDCLRHNPAIFTREECRPFYEADRTAGFRLVWQYYFTTKSDKSKYQILAELQKTACCGFFPPFDCMQNNDKYPATRDSTGIDSKFLSRRVTCSKYAGYYMEQDNCVDYYDLSTDPPTVGGCKYDLGVGLCVKLDITGSDVGCASATEDYVVSLVAAHAPMLLLCSVFDMFYMIIACCMWWKRKESDVFPAFLNPVKVRVSSIEYLLWNMLIQNIACLFAE